MNLTKIKKTVKDFLKYLEYKNAKQLNPTGELCIFRCKGGNPGLFSYVISTLGFVRWAHKKGFRPVIDLQSFTNTYLGEDSVGTLNAWDYYFEQPVGVSYEECINSNDSIKIFDTSEPNPMGVLKSPWWDWEVYNQRSATCKMWRAYAHRYIRFSKQAQQRIDKTWNELVSPNDRVLGIQCRGTDYTRHKPKAHPVQPEPEMVIEKAKQLVKERNYNKIFLATEDGIIFKQFQKEFGDMIIASDKSHVDYDGNAWINSVLPSGQQEKLEHGMDYLVSMAMLTRCDAFIAGRTSGSLGVMCLSKGFEYTYIWDLGVY